MHFFVKIKKIILDTLFPVSCLSCGAPEHWVCEQCFAETKMREQQSCPWCEKIATLKGKLCFFCKEQKKSRLDGLVAAVSYENPFVKQATYNLKYRFASELASPLSEILLKSLLENDISLPKYVVPVPLHRRRLRWRGFNQSQLLAEKISAGLAPPVKIEMLDALERRKHKKPQMEIKKYRDRLDNVKGIFSLKTKPSKIKGARILLVDDIATTGATLQECAGVLKENGARYVFAAVIARQTMKQN
ncbi:MAG: ComF family protein [Patescibacteria group bacterium]|nr:ComF family protein [Patescibacteria group bacterium]